MSSFNFNNKTFLLVENSENGTTNNDTIFKYHQDGNLVTADYSGGTIKYGKIISVLDQNQLDMRYQCVTMENELKSGKAIADISYNEQGKINLKLHWEWIDDSNKKGTSEYIEQ